MKTLFILNDAPYGSERTYNGLRVAGHLSKQEGNSVRVFLIGRRSLICPSQPESATGFLQY